MLKSLERYFPPPDIKSHKTIYFYRKNVYGANLEYINNPGDAKIVFQLTGQKTINKVIRELLRDLTGGYIQWEEVIGPSI